MMTQRDLDIARVEAKVKVMELVQQWQKDFLGKRAKNNASTRNQAQRRAGPQPY